MIITNPVTEVIYFKIYKDYFEVPRNKTSPNNRSTSYCKKTDGTSGVYFLEYDFYIADDFTKEPFFVYRIKNSFDFVVENEEKDLIDLGHQKAYIRTEIITFIKDNSMNYVFENIEHMFSQHNDLGLINSQGFYV